MINIIKHWLLRCRYAAEAGTDLAGKDLMIRGAGEVLGTRQTGVADFRIAELSRDAHLLGAVTVLANNLMQDSPADVALLVRRWIGDQRREYGAV